MGASEDVLDFLGDVGGEISDHLGRVTPIIAQAMPYPGSQASLSTLLGNLEKKGLIARDVRHRRTYAVKLTASRPRSPGSLPSVDEAAVNGSAGNRPGRASPADNGGERSAEPSTPARRTHTPAQAWEAERAIYSAAVARARLRIGELEDLLALTMSESREAVRRADDLQEQVGMAERTIASMRTQLLDARKQLDLLRRKGPDRRPLVAPPGPSHGATGADWDRLMRQRPDR